MEVILSESWSYCLYQEGDEFFLLTVCGGVGIYEVVIKLSDDELACFKKEGKEYIEKHAQKIRFSPSSYHERSIRGFKP